MKLLTKALLASLPPLYSTENVEAEDKVAVVKFFDPAGRYTFYVTEGGPDNDDVRLFGYVVSPLGPGCDEWGYASLNELQEVTNRFGLGIERDIHWKPTKMSKVLKGVA